MRFDLQREGYLKSFSKEALDLTPHTFGQWFTVIKAVHSFPLLLYRVNL